MSIAAWLSGQPEPVAGPPRVETHQTPDERIAATTAAVAEAEAARPVDEEAVADALWHQGRAYAAADRTPEALGAYDALIERFSASPSEPVSVLVGKAYRGRAGRWLKLDLDAAEVAARQSIELLAALADRFDPAFEPLAESRRVLAVVLSRRGDHDAALALLDDAERLLATRPSTEALRRTHARSMSTRALVLSRLGRDEQALQVRQRLVDLHGADDDADIALQTTTSELVLAERADQQGDRAGAYERLERLVERHANAAAPEWPKPAEAALSQLGSFLWRDDRDAEALHHFDRWLHLFAGDRDPARRTRELRVRYRRARALGEVGREPEALQALDELLADAKECGEAEAQGAITSAVVARVGLLHRSRGRGAALRALREAHARLAEHPTQTTPGTYVELLYAELPLWREANRLRPLRDASRAFVERFGDSHDLMAERGLAYAWQFRARVAWDLGDPDGETTALETMVARLGHSSDPAVLDRVDQSRARLVHTLAQAGRYDALLGQVAATVKRFEAARTDEELTERGQRAIRGLGALAEAHLLRDVRPLAERVFARAQSAGEALGDIAIRALHVVAACQQEAGEQEAFEGTYDRLFEFGEHSVAMYRQLSDAFASMDTEFGHYQHAFHLFGLAKALEAVGRDRECLEVIEQAFALYGDDQADGLPEMMDLAREDRDELRERLAG